MQPVHKNKPDSSASSRLIDWIGRIEIGDNQRTRLSIIGNTLKINAILRDLKIIAPSMAYENQIGLNVPGFDAQRSAYPEICHRTDAKRPDYT